MSWTPPNHEPGTKFREATSPDHWAEGVRVILERHGLASSPLKAFPTGSDVVYGTPTHVVKLTHPRWAEEMDKEWTGLTHAGGRLRVRIPEPVALGTLEGWPYVVSTRIPGTALSGVWPDLDHADRTRLAGDLGRLVRELHDLDAEPDPAWPAFLQRLRLGVVENHRSVKVDEAWIPQVESWMHTHWPPPERPHAFLHTEVLDEHVFVESVDGVWQLAGMLDFADGRYGHVGYEFPAMAEFIVKGDRDAWRGLLLGYGLADSELTTELSHEFLTWSLTHQFGSLPRMVAAVGDPAPTSLEELAARLYPV